MQDNALTTNFLLELFHIRSDYQTARDAHAERQDDVVKLQEEHAEGNSVAELEKQMASLKKQKAAQKRKIDERKRAREQEVNALSVLLAMYCDLYAHGRLQMQSCVHDELFLCTESKVDANQGGLDPKEQGACQD